jgi:hypothetical protein
VNPERLACVSSCGALGTAAIIFVIVLLVLYVQAGRAPEE